MPPGEIKRRKSGLQPASPIPSNHLPGETQLHRNSRGIQRFARHNRQVPESPLTHSAVTPTACFDRKPVRTAGIIPNRRRRPDFPPHPPPPPPPLPYPDRQPAIPPFAFESSSDQSPASQNWQLSLCHAPKHTTIRTPMSSRIRNRRRPKTPQCSLTPPNN